MDFQNQQSFTSSGSGIGGKLVTQAQLAGVPAALAGAEATMQDLGSRLAAVIDRLDRSGVLKPNAPKAASGSGQPTPPTYNTSLANAIDRLRMMAVSLSFTLGEVEERLDL